jgi:hypothetical protein
MDARALTLVDPERCGVDDRWHIASAAWVLVLGPNSAISLLGVDDGNVLVLNIAIIEKNCRLLDSSDARAHNQDLLPVRFENGRGADEVFVVKSPCREARHVAISIAVKRSPVEGRDRLRLDVWRCGPI